VPAVPRHLRSLRGRWPVSTAPERACILLVKIDADDRRSVIGQLLYIVHLVYDREHHAETSYRTRREGKALDMFDTAAAPSTQPEGTP
jgi:hypothetical protein